MHCMNSENVEEYNKRLEENIFLVMEMGKQNYSDVMKLPVSRFENYMLWKTKLEEEKQKLIEEEMTNMKGKVKI